MYEIILNANSEGIEVTLAKITAQLVKEGVVFKVVEDGANYVIKMTGGF